MEREIKTPCANCVFAEFTDGQQTGCEAGFLERYQRAGYAELVGDSYIINDKMCLGCRLKDSVWTKQFNEENLLAHLQKEIRFRCDVIVPLSSETTESDIEKTTQSLLRSSIRPDKVIYVYHTLNVGYAKLLKYVNGTYAGTGVKWQIKEVDNTEATIEDMIAESNADCVSEFSTVWVAGSEIPEGFIEQLRVFLREEMRHFILILPNESGEGLVLHKKALMAAGGNAPIEVMMEDQSTVNVTNFVEKLIILSREKGKIDYIWNHNYQPLQS